MLPKPPLEDGIFGRSRYAHTAGGGAGYRYLRHYRRNIFPPDYGIIDHAAAQQFEITPQGLRLTLQRGTLEAPRLPHIEGVLVLHEKRDSASRARAFTISALPGRAS